jgi:hypothetical protein
MKLPEEALPEVNILSIAQPWYAAAGSTDRQRPLFSDAPVNAEGRPLRPEEVVPGAKREWTIAKSCQQNAPLAKRDESTWKYFAAVEYWEEFGKQADAEYDAGGDVDENGERIKERLREGREEAEEKAEAGEDEDEDVVDEAWWDRIEATWQAEHGDAA